MIQEGQSGAEQDTCRYTLHTRNDMQAIDIVKQKLQYPFLMIIKINNECPKIVQTRACTCKKILPPHLAYAG